MRRVSIKDLGTEQKNQVFFLLTSVCYTFAVGLCSEGYLQAYLLACGLDSSAVGIYGFTAQISALAAYVLFLGISPMKKGFLSKYTFSVFLLAVLPVGFILSTLLPLPVLPVAMAAAVVYNLAVAYKGTGEYGMTPYLFNRAAYGPLMGKSGVIGGLIAIAVTTIASGIVSRVGFPYGYYILFLIAVFAFACAGFSSTRYQFIPSPGETPKEKISYLSLVRKIFTKKYLRLLLPHFLRGVGMAGMYFFMTVSLSIVSLSDSQITLSVAVSVAAAAAGNLLFMFLIKKTHSGTLTLLSNIICGVSIVAASLNHNVLLFFVIYFIYMIANTISSVSIPTGVLGCTPNEDLPFMSALRMLVSSASNSIFVLLFGYLLKIWPSVYIMGFAAVIFILCGIYCKFLFTDQLTHYVKD